MVFRGDCSEAIAGIERFRDVTLPQLVDWIDHAEARYIARGLSKETSSMLIDRDLSAWFGMKSLEQAPA